MKIEILHQPDSAIARVILDVNEELVAQAGSMIAMSGHINASTTLRKGKGGGLLGGFKRLVAGESLFLSVFRSPIPDGEVFLAPKFMGDLLVYEMKGQELVVQATSYLASESGVDIDLGFQGLKSLFSGESIFWLSMSGYGYVLLNSFGAIYEVPVQGEYIVDTGHIVAFEKSLTFEITKAGSSWIGAFLGGEGLVCRFKGEGKLYCQTHNPGAFGSLVGSKLPPR
ncbi:MAG TPA: TIGR00266 family protein [Cyanobacteria bacterium UBA11149]|nr:TIGR00266 family protein [Cyanobacteria bacterium UBA11367]HBE57475.1 TIGR00266 family protein [Cyanobacteria bacterium UBA11366]HBK62616.1 TIGR00266 family protein [Cyanobacteria bacterium UBA11166]HBR75780.1 TIGR00266 family protein [Cyanobacteria bacterium UBA11159]HBS69905.1 TIGR00266 family protein [Cyanobacteria bacterium UBA11153]HBW89313.1 TIGR00266 family protein [Cyanobacteria bacterium UBA11149]HCA93239.1 TIGR00266 family protein [Cyanobacteria bacterium UBA9226]